MLVMYSEIQIVFLDSAHPLPPPVTAFKGRLFVDTDKENDLRVAIKQCVYDKKDTIPAIVCVFSTVRLGKIFTNCYRKAR